MIVSINQPAYFPWLGYFQRIAVSDLHVVLDHVQFEKNSFTNRNRIRTADGWTWLTAPVKTKGRFGECGIKTLELDATSNWREKHWKSLLQNHCKCPYWKDHAAFLEAIYVKEWLYLADLCREMTTYFLKALGIGTPIQYSSNLTPQQAKDELVLELCKKVGATVYLSGTLGRNYLREPLFTSAGIRVIYQDYHHPVYPQHSRDGFEPYMSILDLLVNCGPESRAVLLQGQEVHA